MYDIKVSLTSMREQNKLVYLAIPYSWNPEKAFEIANVVARYCFENGVSVFSPVSHSHPIDLVGKNPIKHETWLNFDTAILLNCYAMILVYYGNNGHELIEQSLGCQREIEFCQQHGIQIFRCDVTDKSNSKL
jgi:hypothetical protein